MTEIYLDANASAPLRPCARAAILDVLDLGPGNASSPHAAGRRLRKALGDAREKVAALVGALPSEVVFTSGATESNALAIRGALVGASGAFATTRAEHTSVARIAERLETEGREVRRADVDRWGRFDAKELARLAEGAALVSAVLAQSVTGALEPIAELAARLAGRVPLHVDAVQAAGRIDVVRVASGAAFVSLSAHKLGGPQGIGALVVREGAAFATPLAEGTQERGRRAGTEAVALAAGFAAAAEEALARHAQEANEARAALAPLAACIASLEGEIWTPPEDALPNTLLVALHGCRGDALLAALDAEGIRVSTGSACASGARLAPEVLLAGGRSREDASRAVRISASWATRADEILALVAALPRVVARVRGAGPTS